MRSHAVWWTSTTDSEESSVSVFRVVYFNEGSTLFHSVRTYLPTYQTTRRHMLEAGNLLIRRMRTSYLINRLYPLTDVV